MKPKEIKEILNDLGAGMRKSLGQHFLIDKKILADIVETADIKKGETVLEVGPGLGVLTRELLNKGANVITIETDKKFAAFLPSVIPVPSSVIPAEAGIQSDVTSNQIRDPERKGMDSSRSLSSATIGDWNDKTSLRIIQGDAAKLDWDKLVPKEWKFVSNLPYSITSLALRKALTAKHPPAKIVVLLQREVAERAISQKSKVKSQKNKGSLLSLMIALNANSARIVRRVGKGAFYPPPKVQSAVLEIIPLTQAERIERWGIDTEAVMKVAKTGFAHPRKLVVSNLGIEASALEEVGLQPKARAEDLRTEDWVNLAKRLN